MAQMGRGGGWGERERELEEKSARGIKYTHAKIKY